MVEITYPVFNVEESLKEGTEKTANLVLDVFLNLLKTRYYTLAQLKRMGHPYARRHYVSDFAPEQLIEAVGFRGVDLGIINKQTGRLVKAVRREVKVSKNESEARVLVDNNLVKYAPFVFFGTKKLIARPLHQTIALTRHATFTEIFFKYFIKRLVRDKKTITYTL